MSDNVSITPGTGAVIGADSCTVNGVAGVMVPLGKIGFGANDSWTYVTSSAGLPVAQQGTWSVEITDGTNTLGTSAHPVRTDPTGTTTQPVSVAGPVAVTGTFWQATQPVSAASLPLPTGAAQESGGNLAAAATALGAPADAAAASDAATSSLVGLLKRACQRITSLIGLLPSALTGSGNLKVALQESNAAQAVTGTFWQATQPVSLASLPALAAGSQVEITDGTNVLGTSAHPLKVDNSAQTQPVSAASLPLPANAAQESGGVLSAIAGKLGTLGQKGMAGSAPVAIASDQSAVPTLATPQAGTSGGYSPYHALTANTTNATVVKASPGQVGGITLTNANTSAARYFRLYDSATTPTPGTTPIKLLICVPAAASASQPTVVTLNNPTGIAFAGGIAYAVTLAMADGDATALTASGDMSIDLLYK